MKLLLGSCHHNSTFLYDLFSKYTGVKVAFHDSEHVDKANLVIVDDYSYFKRNAATFDKMNAVVVLLGSPIMLNEVAGLTFLDVGKRSQSYMFKLCPVDKALVLKAVKAAKAKTVEKLVFDLKRLDMIADCIAKEKSTGFLHVFNTFVLRCTGNKTGVNVKGAILKYLFGEWTEKNMDKAIGKELPSKGATPIIYAELKAYLKKHPTIFKALKDVANDNAPDHNKIAKRHGVDPYETRYLLASYKAFKKIKPKTIRSEIKATLASWDGKSGGRKKRALERLKVA